MNAPAGMPSKTQTMGLDEQMTWVNTVIEDLHQRACALERLVDSGLQRVGFVAEGDGPAVVTVRVDRTAWFTAVDIAMTPRPEFPGTTKAAPPG
jgi:hypothetical protein